MKLRNVMTGAIAGIVAASSMIMAVSADFTKTGEIKKGKFVVTIEMLSNIDASGVSLNTYYQDATNWSWNACKNYPVFETSKTLTLEWDLAEVTAADDTVVGKFGFQLGNCPSLDDVKVNVKEANVVIGDKTYSITGLLGEKIGTPEKTQWGNIADINVLNDGGVIAAKELTAAVTTTTAAVTTTTAAAATSAKATTTTTASTTTTSPETGDTGVALAVASLMAAAGLAVFFRKKD